jgi:hypothetical protein
VGALAYAYREVVVMATRADWLLVIFAVVAWLAVVS